MSMPEFESEKQKITTSYNNENKAVKKSVFTLKWTDEWTKWFEEPTTDFGTFIEALAEHPEIRCIDFSHMPKDSVGHKKYLTENAAKQLLKVNDVYFVCRYMPENTAGSLDDWEKLGQAFNLSFVKKQSGDIATWRYFGDKNNKIENKQDGGWLIVRSQDCYVVSKTEENGKRRLLWNRAALKNVLNAYDQDKGMWSIRKALTHFSGREKAEDLAKNFSNLRKEGENWKQFMSYKPIDIIDFTIGDPKDKFAFGDRKCTWKDVHKIVSSGDFVKAVKEDRTLRDIWTEIGLEKELTQDDKAENDKKLTAEKRRELEERLRLVKQVTSKELKELIREWNKKNTKHHNERTEKDAFSYGAEVRKTVGEIDVTYPGMTVKNLQLNENVNFMEQWDRIKEKGTMAWKEEDRLKLIKALKLGKSLIVDLNCAGLLEYMWQWKHEMREAFIKQWNKKYKNDKNKKDNQSPSLFEDNAGAQWIVVDCNWDTKFKTALAAQLRIVELLNLLEQCQGNAKKAFVGQWNKDHATCKCHALDATLEPVQQAETVRKWKKCSHCETSSIDLKNELKIRLSWLDRSMNFMARWSKDKQKTFIEGWNNGHEKHKLLPDAEPFEQFSNIFKWENGAGLRDELEKQMMRIELSYVIDGLNKICERRSENKENLMQYLRCIRHVSMLAYADCIGDKQKQDLAQSGWIVKPYKKGGKPYKKGDRSVVEIKYEGLLRPGIEWSGEEIKDIFNPNKEEVKRKKADGERVFASDSDVFEEPTRRVFVPKKDEEKRLWEDTFVSGFEPRRVWSETGMENGLSDIDVPTTKKGKDAFHFNPKDGLRSGYYTLPFGKFLESLKKAKTDLAKLDLTKFEDKGAKISLDEFLKHPLWTFRVPMNRLRELKKYEALYFIKILETKENTVTFIVFPQLQLKKAENPKYGRSEYLLAEQEGTEEFAKQYFTEFTQQLVKRVRMLKPMLFVS